MAVKTYRYKLAPTLNVKAATYTVAPVASEVSGGPYTLDVQVDESEKQALDKALALHCWEFVEEVPP